MKLKNLLKNYSLSLTLTCLFLVSWIGQLFFQWQEFVQTSIKHSQRPQVSQFIPEFLSATLENWQSEFLQLLTFVVLTTFLIHKDSPESRDSSDKMEEMIQNIEKRIETISRKK